MMIHSARRNSIHTFRSLYPFKVFPMFLDKMNSCVQIDQRKVSSFICLFSPRHHPVIGREPVRHAQVG